METETRFTFPRGRAALLATAFLIAPLFAGEMPALSGAAERELAKRVAGLEEARELLGRGDEAYESERYDHAVEAYAGARELIVDAPVTAELRAGATDRYALASIAHARHLARKGDLAGAKAVMDKVLAPSVAPDHAEAKVFRNQLDDPIRYNPASTKEHSANVDSVRRLLYTAEGAYNLGKFDEAKKNYEDVLRIDPYNSAARRGIERVTSAKAAYQNTAYDHARAEMLGEVAGAWELELPPVGTDVPEIYAGGAGRVDAGIPVSNKLDRIIIPVIDLNQTSLDEAIDFLRVRAAEMDNVELDPARKGVNFNVDLGPAGSPAAAEVRAIRFDLRLRNVPLSQVLRYLTDQTRTTFTTDEFSVIIRPLGASREGLVTRSYRVPPDFMGNLSSSAPATDGAAASPFDEPTSSGLLPQRRDTQEVFQQMGVSFPEGATVVFNRATSTLRVVNTEANHDLINQIIQSVTLSEPVMVAVRVTMIRAEQRRLEELGFDWLLDDYGFGGNSWIPGASKLNLTGGTQGNGGDLSDVPLAPGTFFSNPITAGNRSGDDAIIPSAIDDAIARNTFGAQGRSRAPGTLGVSGFMGDAAVSTLMRGLDQKKGVDLMATPATVTRSGQASSIHIIREFIYPTEYEPPELPNSVGSDVRITGGGVPIGLNIQPSPAVTPATPTAFEKRDTGIVLEVLPTADAEKRYVDIALNPSIVDFDGFVNYGSPILGSAPSGVLGLVRDSEPPVITDNAILMPVFSVNKLATNLTVADGATIVIGGLLKQTLQNVEDQTPVLGSIPGVGRLFQSKAKQPVSTAVIFLVNVELLDPTGRPYRDR